MKRKHKDLNGVQGAAFGVMEGTIMMLSVLVAIAVATGSKQIALIGVVSAGLADALANSAAFPRPTIPGTFSVPARRCFS